MSKYKIKYKDKDEIKELVLDSELFNIESLPANVIDIQKHKSFNLNFQQKLNDKSLNLLFYELNLILNANINIKDALNILIKNKKDKKVIKLLEAIKISLSSNKKLDDILHIKVNKIVISFFFIIKKYGNIQKNIKALSNILKQEHDIKKDFQKALYYPAVLSISLIICFFLIFDFVIPKFKLIFSQTVQNLPLATKALLKTQEIFQNYYLFICSIVFFIIFTIIIIYQQNKTVRYTFDKILLCKIPLISDIYSSMEFYRFFYMTSVMLESKYEFHKTLDSAKILIKNKYLLDKIEIINSLLKNGKTIHTSFEKTNLFDDIVLNLLNTGEISNCIDITIKDISKIYKNRFDEKINLFISLIQPIFLLIIMALILWVILGIFIPIWDMGNLIKTS